MNRNGDPADRLRALEADNRRLRELASAASRLAEFGRFAAEQNHELKQPLLAIKGLAQLLLDKDRLDPDEVRESARHIVEQADRMTRLLAEFKRMSSPRRAPQAGRTDLGTIVARAVSLFDYRLRNRAQVLTDVAPDAPPVAASPDQVEQIVINLLANAIDAVAQRPSSFIQIRVRKLDVDGRPMAELWVADNGSGVSARARPRLFEAFFTTKGDDSGTGLGLAVSREIARGAGGDLEIAEATGSWPQPAVTVFRLTLPAA